MPSLTAPDTSGDAKQMHCVTESQVSGGVGPALIPFFAPTDADSFVTEYGGQIVRFDEITPEPVASYTRQERQIVLQVTVLTVLAANYSPRADRSFLMSTVEGAPTIADRYPRLLVSRLSTF